MVDISVRLESCFTSVFPDLLPDAARRACANTVPAWDSLATVTLVTLVEEEFGIAVDLEDIIEFSSFPRIATYLEQRLQT